MSRPIFDLREIVALTAIHEKVDGWIDGHWILSYTVGVYSERFGSRGRAEAFAASKRDALIHEAITAAERYRMQHAACGEAPGRVNPDPPG